MATLALYRKWRSQGFDDLIGQQHVTQTLQNALETDRVGHAYLFTGPRGTGKTSTARILAKAVNCTGDGQKPCNNCTICQAITEGRLMDLIEIDAASNTSVDDIRDLRDKVGFRPGEARMKFYIIDEVHMLSKSAFNALLKTLEEPPDHVIFVLATTEPEKIPATILSRCQRFDFRRIKVDDIAGRLRFILDEEGLHAEDDALAFIARQAGGSMRDAISLLDQLTAYGQDEITLELVQSVLGAANSAATASLVDALLAGDMPAGLKLIDEVVNGGADPRQFTLDVLEYLRALMLLKFGDAEQFLSVSPEVLEVMQAQASNADSMKLLQMTQRFNRAVQDFKSSVGEVAIPQLPLELAFVESIVGQPKVAAVAAQPSVVAQPRPAAKVSSPPASSPVSSPPVASPDVAVSAPVESLSKDELRARWSILLEEVGKRGKQYQGYLKKPMVQDVDIQGNVVVIVFGHQYSDAAKRADKHKEKIIDAFHSVLGSSWQVRFDVASDDAPVSDDAAASPANPLEDELVQEALQMGGKLANEES